MIEQALHNQRLTWRLTAAICGIACCVGCQSKAPRVYKVAYTAPNSAETSDSQWQRYGPDNSLSWTAEQSSGEFLVKTVAPLPVASTEYHLGPGDEIRIKVWQLLDLDREETEVTRVDLQGEIYLPYLHDVQVAGLTIDQLQRKIVDRLKEEYIKDPQVDARIVKFRSKEVIVLGAISTSGSIFLEKDNATLLDVIGQAGGISSGAAPSIEILRGAYNPISGAKKGIPSSWIPSSVQPNIKRELVPVTQLFAEEGPLVNPLIYPGDVVKVRSASEGYIYVSGEVKQPGAKRYHRPLNILQAITVSGGLSPIAEEKNCKIIRRLPNGEEQVIYVDLDRIITGEHPNLAMAQNDMIVIPVNKNKKFWYDLDKFFSRGVRAGVDMTYNAAADMGIPNSGTGF